MEMIKNVPKRKLTQYISCDVQLELITECLLMAGAIKRHNEDAALLMGDARASSIINDMNRVLEGANNLLAEAKAEKPLNALEWHELRMVWNKLRYFVTSTYQGEYFSSKVAN